MATTLERRVVRFACRKALADGFALNIENGGDSEELTEPTTKLNVIMSALMAAGMDRLILYRDGRPWSWLLFVYGGDAEEVLADGGGRASALLDMVCDYAATVR